MHFLLKEMPKLYLCHRWAGYPGADLVAAAVEKCDVVSYNWYHNEANEHDPPFPDLAEMRYDQLWQAHVDSSGNEKPALIGEFTVGTFESASVATGVRHASTMRQRGRIAAHFWKTALNTPNIVGAHMFRWSDQYVSGRSDGESFQNGFVTTLDYPYYEFIKEIQLFTHSMYSAEFGHVS